MNKINRCNENAKKTYDLFSKLVT